MAPVIEARGLTRSFGDEVALDGLDLEIAAGEVFALLGPNGAGKTTTVRLLNGVLRPDQGLSRVLGLDPATDGDVLRRRTGVLTETAGLDDRLTAMENLVTVARLRGMAVAEARRRSGELLERFDLGRRADDLVQGFSTGQRKRVALARSLLHDPELLFLDEPTSGLDPAATRDVIELIASLAADQGRTVVLCTHFLAEAGRLASRVAVLHRGALQAAGSVDELAARFWEGLDVELDLGGRASDGLVEVLAGAPGVVRSEATATGARVRVDDRAAVPRLVATLVAHEVPVYAATPCPPTLEDVYFAVQAQVSGQQEHVR